MSENGREIPWLDARSIENWRGFPVEELAKYAGLHVAYPIDGARVLASGESPEAVEEQLKAAGIDPGQVIFGYVDAPASRQ